MLVSMEIMLMILHGLVRILYLFDSIKSAKIKFSIQWIPVILIKKRERNVIIMREFSSAIGYSYHSNKRVGSNKMVI